MRTLFLISCLLLSFTIQAKDNVQFYLEKYGRADPWAIALPDGYIIIASQTLDICYKNVSKEIGDTRIAFILGHELAHLANLVHA